MRFSYTQNLLAWIPQGIAEEDADSKKDFQEEKLDTYETR